MIVVDTSAVLAVLYRETETEQFFRLIIDADICFMSTVAYVEASMVLIGRGIPEAARELDNLLEQLEIEFVSLDFELAKQAREAFVRFGKGRHPARLNLGDCVSYALAQSRGLPLLYKSDDFAQTDIVSAVRPG